MPHLHRFYIPEGLCAYRAPGTIPLSTEEAHHALRVLRLRPEDTVALFDGQGYHGEGQVEALGKREAVVRVERIDYTPPQNPAVTLLQAMLQRDKAQEEVVRDATVLGVAQIVFFDAARSIRARKSRLEKWRKIAVEACKQCGRAWLPAIATADSLEAALASTEGLKLALLLDESPQPWTDLPAMQEAVALVVGPEGDFTPDEQALLRSACRPVSLGAYVYRAETAAMLGVTLLQHHAGHLGPLR